MLDVKVIDMTPLAVGSVQAAQLLSVSPRKLYDLTSPRGPIRTAKIGREHRYPVEELQRFLREGLSSDDTSPGDGEQ